MKKTYLILPVISTLVIGTISSTTVSGIKFSGDYPRNAYAPVVDHTKASIALFNRIPPIERYKAYVLAQAGFSLQGSGCDVIFQQDQDHSIKLHTANASLPWEELYPQFSKILATGADVQTDFVFNVYRSIPDDSYQGLISTLNNHNLPYTWSPDGRIQALRWKKHHIQTFNAAIYNTPWARSIALTGVDITVPINAPVLFSEVDTGKVYMDHFMKTIGSLRPDAWTIRRFQ